MRRRALLTSVASTLPAALAGCTGEDTLSGDSGVAKAPTARLEMTSVTDEELPEKALYRVGPEDETNERTRLFDRSRSASV